MTGCAAASQDDFLCFHILNHLFAVYFSYYTTLNYIIRSQDIPSLFPILWKENQPFRIG